MSKDLPEKDGEKESSETVFTPDELDITAREEVEEIDDGRYVVSASGGRPNVDSDTLEQEDWVDDEPSKQQTMSSATETGTEPEPVHDDGNETQSVTETSQNESNTVKLTDERVTEFIGEALLRDRQSYGFDLTVVADGTVSRRKGTSNDIGVTLRNLLTWFAEQTADGYPPEEAIGLMLAGGEFDVRYPPQNIASVVKHYELTPDDSIEELLKAVREDGELVVPHPDN